MKKQSKSGLDRLLGTSPLPLAVVLQFFLVAVFVIIANQILVDYLIPTWYKRGLASSYEMWDMALRAKELLFHSWSASIRHLLIGVVGSVPGFLVGVRLATYRSYEPAILFVLGLLICYPKLAVVIVLGFVVVNDEMSIYMYGWFVSFVYAMAVGYFNSRPIVNGVHGVVKPELLHLAVLHFSTRSRFYWFFLLPHSMKDFPVALMWSSVAVCSSFIFTESRVGGPGIGYEAYYVVSNSQNIPLFHVAALTIGLTNLFFWASISGLRQWYWPKVENLIASFVDNRLRARQ